MTRLVVRIGPLTESTGAPGLSAFFLFPGDPDRPVVFADRLAGALPELRAIAGTDPLAAEPALAAEAAPLGLPTRPLDDDARALLGTLALDIAARDAFSAIERDGLIDAFARAAAAFAARHPEAWPEDLRRLVLAVAGEEAPRPALVIAGPGLVLPDPAGEGTEGLGAVFAPGPPEVADALARAYGMRAVPEPFRHAGGDKLRVTDDELALLAAALLAVAELPPEPGARRRARVEAEGCAAEVEAARPAP